jgi:RimJ/RimL family protein N-acetyltransferase
MIQGKLVRLRAVEPEDLPKTVKILNDPEVSIPLGALYLGIALEEEEQWYVNYLKGENHLSSLVIENLETGEHMGHIGFNSIHLKNRKATTGLFLAKEYWGKGYGTDAMMALCHFGFMQMNLQKIQLYVFAPHKRGIRSYEKCGFQTEVVMREHAYVDGRFVDDLIMGVLMEEFMPIYENYMRSE